MKPLPGVYQIRNLLNGKRYIGSGAGKQGVLGRLSHHRRYLGRGKHSNKHLQSAWNKSGEKVFAFEALEYCAQKDCLTREQYWIDHYRSYERHMGYNRSPSATSVKGLKWSAASKKKLAEIARNRKPASDEVKAKKAAASRAYWSDPRNREARSIA